jgi:hypothetical protein
VYDYGQGGIWAVVEAISRELIADRFPELQIFERAPAWMDEQTIARIEGETLSIEAPSGLLADIVRQRRDAI